MSLAAVDPRLEELAFLRALGEVMASDLRADKALARAVDLCFVRFELGALCAFRVDDGVFRLVAGHGIGATARKRLQRVTSRELSVLLGGNLFALSHEIGLSDECTALSDEEDAMPGRSALFAPLVYARRRLGALLVIGNRGERFDAATRQTWEPVVDTISVALRAADDFERVVALEAEKRQLVDNLPLIVARFDSNTGTLLFVNGAVQRVLGLRPSDALVSLGFERALVDELERDASRAARQRAAQGHHSPWQDRRYRHADGRALTLRECVYPVYDGTHAVHAIEIIAYDITTEIEARREVMQADRLTALGALAAGVAHEINNPVAFISLAAAQLARLIQQAERGEAEALSSLREVAFDIGESANRIASIVGELKLFTRIGDGSIASPVDVNRILQTALALTSSELRRHARLEIDLGDLPVGPGAFVNLGHAFVNLLMNAAQAVESKLARADLRAVGRPIEPNVIRVVTRLSEGSIVVTVEDSGIGIEDRALPRIFDPFFTTDASGGGTGLGLAIAYDLVRRVGGEIRVESRRLEGTKFEVVLPLGADGEAHDVPEAAPSLDAYAHQGAAPGLPARLPRVLIIDDERALVRALARQLGEHYDVETACAARDALAQLSLHSYDVIVCDLRMPDQSGPQLYEEVRRRSSEQAGRFIFTTGGSYGSMDDALHASVEATGLPLLSKPFDGGRLEATVAAVAARPWRSVRASALLEPRPGDDVVADRREVKGVAGASNQSYLDGSFRAFDPSSAGTADLGFRQ